MTSDESRNYKQWWLDRYTIQEIRSFAAAFAGALDIQTSDVQTATCATEGCNTKYTVRAHNQRYCSNRCRKRDSERRNSRRRKNDLLMRQEYVEITDRLGIARDWSRIHSHIRELKERDAA